MNTFSLSSDFRLTLLLFYFHFFSSRTEKIRVGKDYQAIVPPIQTKNDSFNQQEKALLVWAPAVNIPDSKVEEYVTLAKERYGYNTEQALGMLFWHKHDMEKAVIDLGNFTPFPEDWNKEDVVLFEQAFLFHGKCFHRIRQMVRLRVKLR
jgi:REST corepressor 1